MFLEESRDILAALKQEEVKLQRQLKGIQSAILALNGSQPAPVSSKLVSPNGVSRKRTMSAGGRVRFTDDADSPGFDRFSLEIPISARPIGLVPRNAYLAGA